MKRKMLLVLCAVVVLCVFSNSIVFAYEGCLHENREERCISGGEFYVECNDALNCNGRTYYRYSMFFCTMYKCGDPIEETVSVTRHLCEDCGHTEDPLNLCPLGNYSYCPF